MAGWRTSPGSRNSPDLPENARNYLKRIESLTETPIEIVSVGAGKGPDHRFEEPVPVKIRACHSNSDFGYLWRLQGNQTILVWFGASANAPFTVGTPDQDGPGYLGSLQPVWHGISVKIRIAGHAIFYVDKAMKMA